MQNFKRPIQLNAVNKSAKKSAIRKPMRRRLRTSTQRELQYEKTPPATRETLIQVAIKVFAAKGYEGATVKDLAEGAGVNISLVSYHFGGKEGLYRTCLESFGADRAEASERILKSPRSREEFLLRLSLFAEDFIEFHLKNSDSCKVVHRAIDAIDSITADVFKKFFFRVFNALHSFIESAKMNAFLRPELETEITTVLMFGSLMHVLRSQEVARLMGKPTLDNADFRALVIKHWIQNHTLGIFKASTGTQERIIP